MLDKLNAAFTARRVLLVGGHDRMTLFFESLLGALGARPARIPPSSGAETVCRALTAGRVSALIVPSLPLLAPQRDEAVAMLDLSETICRAVQGLSGDGFRNMRLRSSIPNHDHEEIVESIERYAVTLDRKIG